MDTECKGDRVCENGNCVAPPPSTREAPRTPAAEGRNDSTHGQANPPPVQMRRHSTGMMAGGIVMVSLAPIALLVSAVVGLEKSVCNIDNDGNGVGYRSYDCDDYNPALYGSLLTALGLVGAGVPLIVIGAKKEPIEPGVARATVAPWVTPSAAGVALHVNL